MTPGNAWFTSADQQGTTQGALVGYLTPGVQPGANVNAYVFVFGAEQAGGQQYVLVDSCVSTATSPCAIGVGYNAQTQTWQQTFAPDPSVVNGLNVVVLDRVTLTMLQHKTVQSAYDLVSTISTSSLAKFSSHAQSLTGNAPASSPVGPYLTDRIVVIMQSVGTGVLSALHSTQNCPPATGCPGTGKFVYADPLPLIDQLGGTPETFGAAVLDKGKPYALVGVASNLPWHGRGIESSPLINANLPGRSRGVLARDRMARFTPQGNDPTAAPGQTTGLANLGLAPIVYQDPTPWPYAAGDPNATDATKNAIAYIAGQLEFQGKFCDIRSAYLNLNVNWATMLPLIPSSFSSLPAFSTCALTQSIPDPTTYQNIVAQLTHEFRWVEAVKDFITNVMAPFDENLSTTFVDVETIADTIYNSLKPPDTPKSSFSWLNLFNAMTGVASSLLGSDPDSDAAAVFGLASATGYLGADLMGNSSGAPGGIGSAASTIITAASDLASQLSVQIQAHLNAMLRLETILLSDAGKLQMVGTNLIGNPDWAWQPDTTINVESVLSATTTQTGYSALLPLAWPLWNLKPRYDSSLSELHSDDVTQFICRGSSENSDVHPWGAAGNFPGNVFKARTLIAAQEFGQPPLSPPVGGNIYETNNTEAWSFAKISGTFSANPGPDTQVPGTTLTTNIFGTGIDPTTNLVQGAAYPPAWYRQTYNPPPLAICNLVTGDPSARSAPTIAPPN